MKLFGTDGIRGIADELFTDEFLTKIATSVARFLQNENNAKVLICKDTRPSSARIENVLANTLSQCGISVVLGGIVPTPGVHFLTAQKKFDMGIMITASHNPSEYNGLKFITKQGLKFNDEQEASLTNYFFENSLLKSDHTAPVIVDENLKFEWTQFLIQTLNTSFKGKKIALDCANGASFFVAPFVFAQMGAEVFCINNTQDGKLINKDCGSTHLDSILKLTKEKACDLGFAFDGDADRVCVVFDGRIMTGEEEMFLSFLFLLKNNMLKTNKLVTPFVTNKGIDESLKTFGTTVERVEVGGKFIQAKLVEKGISFGAENNGHIVWGDFNKCSDGLLTALFLTKFFYEQDFKELLKGLKLFEQLTKNLIADEEQKQKLERVEVKDKLFEISKQLLKNERFILRPSGTEPLLRIVVEGENLEHLHELLLKLEQIF